MKKLYISIFAFSLILTSCGEESSENTSSVEQEMEDVIDISDTDEDDSGFEMPSELDGIIASMPSPLEIVSTIKHSGATFNASILNDIDNKNGYAKEYIKALNVGVFGTDMSYINIYGKKIHVLKYAGAVQGLAEELNVGQFFDVATFQKLMEHENNMDELILVSTQNYNNMDHFLREQDRGEVSALMAVGAWTEGVYILTDMYNKSKSEILKEKIAEQKIVASLLAEAMDLYSDKETLQNITNQINEINVLFDQVKEVTVEGEIEETEVDGMLVLVDTGYTTFEIADEVLANITEKIKALRNDIIKTS